MALEFEAGEALDRVAALVFEGDAGAERLRPLRARFDAEVAVLREDDAYAELLHAIRADWALCDAPVPGGTGTGDTWLRRAASGRVEGLDPELARPLLATITGLFEVWPGKRAWLRDVVRGVSLELGDAVHLEKTERGMPAALWELRLILRDGTARLCRPPLPYPLEVWRVVEDLRALRWQRGSFADPTQDFRRLWLHVHRAPRADAVAVFGPLLRPSKRG